MPGSIDSFPHRAREALEFPVLLDRLARGCRTEAGRRFLLALEPTGAGEAAERLCAVRDLGEHAGRVGRPPVPDPAAFERALRRLLREGGGLEARELGALLAFLRALPPLRRHLDLPASPATPVRRDFLDRLADPPGLRDLLERAVTPAGEVLDSASPELAAHRARLRLAREEVSRFFRTLMADPRLSSVLQDGTVTEREGRAVVPVRRDRAAALPGWVHGVSGSGATLFVEPQGAVDLNNRVREAAAAEEEEVRRVLAEVSEAVRAAGKILEGILDTCARIDALDALGDYAARFGGSFLVPGASGDGALVLSGARHPLLALEAGEAFRERVVPLDLRLPPEAPVLLLSGPNAGGKTVALKTVGLAVLAAHAGIPVLAAPESCVPELERLDTDLGDEQDLKEHLSSYAAKLAAHRRMLESAGPAALLLLDELGSGTDPLEGGALSLALLEALKEAGARVLATTHQPHLKAKVQERRGFRNACMLFDSETGGPTFRLQEGYPGTSQALLLARRLGFPKELLERARAHLPEGEWDVTRILADLAAEKAKWEAARREAEALRERLEREGEEVVSTRRGLAAEARAAREEARRRAAEIVREVRRRMERLIQGVEGTEGNIRRRVAAQARREMERELEALEEGGGEDSPPPGDLEALREGARVFWTRGRRKGRLLRAPGGDSKTEVLMDGGLRVTCPAGELELLPEEKPSGGFVTVRADLPGRGGGSPLELDLRGLRAHEAEAAVERFLDAARASGLPFVRILHGKGTGSLRRAVQRCLEGRGREVAFGFARPEEGGAGVTVVEFKDPSV